MAPRASRTSGYDSSEFPPFAVTVDVVVLTLVANEPHVLLVERGDEPYKSAWAIPGGFVRPDEDLDTAAERELYEETAVRAAPYLEQVGAYGAPDRDPRMRVVTVAYLALMPTVLGVRAGTDARRAQLVPVSRFAGRRSRGKLAFDHKQILLDALEQARTNLERTSVATTFLDDEFTIPELRTVYEALWGETLEPANFRRKVLATPGFVTPTGRTATPGPEGGRPPETYTAGHVAVLYPPLRRGR